jgi:uncharacterized repeat protein (TIGR01451 family)
MFAWTYDATNFYMYIRRVGSANNRQMFWYYLDFSGNRRLDAGEPVFHVSWWGNTRVTQTELFRYVPASPAGDPLVDGAGFADGYTMPGSIVSLGVIESVVGGSASGLEMESRLAWSRIGVAAGTPFFFHVASSNSGNVPSQIDDNLGGPGGGIGSTFTPGVAFAPDRSGSSVPAGSAVLAHTITNTGNGSDTFDLSWSASGAFVPGAVTFRLDADADGALDPGDPLLVDTDTDGIPDTGVLGPGATLAVLAVVAVPAGASDGATATVVATATSSVAASANDSVTDDVTVASPALTLVKSVDRATAAPGDVLTYTVAYSSTGTTAAHEVVIVDAVPPPAVYVPGSAAGAGAALAYSHDGGATFDGSDAAPVTHVRFTLAAPLAPGASGSVSFRASVP